MREELNEKRFNRIKELWLTAIGLPNEDVSRSLDENCGSDDDLRAEVQGLLATTGEFDLEAIPESVIAAAILKKEEATEVFSDFYRTAVSERYELLEKAGQGGMGDVYMARDLELGRKVAIKFLPRRFTENRERLDRFRREARAASALNHPNIVTVYDIGESNGVHYIVTEYVEGKTLRSYLAERDMPIYELLDLAIQISSALADAHSAGIIHRDIKPDNVMVRTKDSCAKLLDFGLAKDIGQVSRWPSRTPYPMQISGTLPGHVLGTPQYMSPEQAAGGSIGKGTDIFSFGALLYEMLAGVPAFDGDSVSQVLNKIQGSEPIDLLEINPEIPSDLAKIVRKAIRKRRDDRYASIARLHSDLLEVRELMAGSDIQIRKTASLGRHRSTRNSVLSYIGDRIPLMGLLSASLILLPVLYAGWMYWNSGLDAVSTAAPMTSVRITSWASGPGELASDASFSPDGRMVAYGSAASGSTQIYVVPTSGGRTIRVTADDYYNQHPIWSPDGQEIAFFSQRGDEGGLWRVSFTGGEQRQILSKLGPVTQPLIWAKSGKIYFKEGYEVFAVDPDSGAREQISDFAGKGIRPWVIEMSDDGSLIAFSQTDGDKTHLKVIEAAGSGDLRTLATSTSVINDFGWTGDGKKLIYSTGVDRVYQIMEVDVKSGAQVRLASGDYRFDIQDVSLDGRILYRILSETSDLWKVDVAKGYEEPVAQSIEAEYWADISPDGRKVAYQSAVETGTVFSGTIRVKDLDAEGEGIPVAQEGFLPKWSPDGKRIAYLKREQDLVGLWTVNETGDNPSRIAAGKFRTPLYKVMPYLARDASSIVWSGDSKSVSIPEYIDKKRVIRRFSIGGDGQTQTTDTDSTGLVVCCAFFKDKYTVFSTYTNNLGGTGRRQSTVRVAQEDPVSVRTAYETPNRIRLLGIRGDAAVFVEMPTVPRSTLVPESMKVYEVQLYGSVQRELTTVKNAFFDNIHLSPDGAALAFSAMSETEQGPVSEIRVLNLGNNAERVLLKESDPKTFFSTISWSPDSRSLVFGRQTATNLLSMLVADQ